MSVSGIFILKSFDIVDSADKDTKNFLKRLISLNPKLAGVLLFLAHAFFPAYGGLFFLFCLFAFVPGVMAIAGISRIPRGAKGICGALYIPASWAAEFFTYVFLSKL